MQVKQHTAVAGSLVTGRGPLPSAHLRGWCPGDLPQRQQQGAAAPWQHSASRRPGVLRGLHPPCTWHCFGLHPCHPIPAPAHATPCPRTSKATRAVCVLLCFHWCSSRKVGQAHPDTHSSLALPRSRQLHASSERSITVCEFNACRCGHKMSGRGPAPASCAQHDRTWCKIRRCANAPPQRLCVDVCQLDACVPTFRFSPLRQSSQRAGSNWVSHRPA